MFVKPTPNGHDGDVGNRRYLVLREATMPIAIGEIHRSGGHPSRLCYPVLTMGNTVDEFMRDLEIEIDDRAQQMAIESTD